MFHVFNSFLHLAICTFFAGYREVNHRCDNDFVVLLLLFPAVSDSPSIPPFSYLSTLVFSFEAQMKLVCLLFHAISASVRLSPFLKIKSLTLFLSVLICLSFSCFPFFTLVHLDLFLFFSAELRGCVVCFLAHLMVVYLFVFFLP